MSAKRVKVFNMNAKYLGCVDYYGTWKRFDIALPVPVEFTKELPEFCMQPPEQNRVTLEKWGEHYRLIRGDEKKFRKYLAGDNAKR